MIFLIVVANGYVLVIPTGEQVQNHMSFQLNDSRTTDLNIDKPDSRLVKSIENFNSNGLVSQAELTRSIEIVQTCNEIYILNHHNERPTYLLYKSPAQCLFSLT